MRALLVHSITYNYTKREWVRLWEVVVAQLVERSLPIPEVRNSNPVTSKNLFISIICLLSTVY